MTTVRIVTFGCKTNQYEGDALASALAQAGVRVDDSAEPDVAIVNSCTVTEKADRRARQAALRIAREHPNARIYITGCYAARETEALRKLPNVAGVVAGKSNLLSAIARDLQLTRDNLQVTARTGPGATSSLVSSHESVVSAAPRTRNGRAYLKIQDGCDSFCSYCIVPLVRPTLWSKPLDDILREARYLVAAGFLEIVLAGIHLGRFSLVGGHPRVPPLGCSEETAGNRRAGGHMGSPLQRVVREVAKTPGLARLRLSSIEIPELADEIIEMMASSRVICPHVHLPLQSGDAGILAAMNRRYTPKQFLATVRRLRERIPDAAVTTDVIVGFPGETDSAFENTLAVVREARFSKVHVFRFSARPGTKAATLPGRVTPRLVTERKRRLMTLADELALDYARRFVGRDVEVIVETVKRGSASGLTERYLRVTFEAGPEFIGRKALVAVDSAGAGTLEGRLVRMRAEAAGPV